jgi:aldehyde:ferredoxin oxidoreductase
MATSAKRTLLRDRRREELRGLVRIYYRTRGWNDSGIPTPDTLQKIGLWDFLTAEARTKIAALAG